MKTITPFLWFDDQAEEAARFYCSVFSDSKITAIARYGPAGPGPEGSVMTVAFEVRGQALTALNGGPMFHFTEAVSFVVDCEDQAEIDYFWDRLSEGGEPSQCGWLKDKYGLSWQIVPPMLPELLVDPDPVKSNRVMAAMLTMQKLDLAALEAAAAG